MRARNCQNRYKRVYLEFSGQIFFECPVGLLKREPWIQQAWEDFLYAKSFSALPKSGGTDDQPAWLISAMLIIESELARLQSNKVEFEYDKKDKNW